AWIEPGQPSADPFYFLFNPTMTDYVFVASNSSTPPTRSGSVAAVLMGFVYTTPICDSVPLYKPSDHYHTTNPAERGDMINHLGWNDGGIIAYVLPIDGMLLSVVQILCLPISRDSCIMQC
ncbi:hypothetical protein CPB84DRAFT_1696968, partial [Gymnopilus junonius]